MIQNTQSTKKPDNNRKIPPVSHIKLFFTFLLIGATSFGGGVAAYIRRVVVEEKQWIDDTEFFRGLSLAQMLPGPNAANMAIFVGRYLRGPAGAALAVSAVLLPAVIILSLVWIFYAQFEQVSAMKGILEGIGACAIGLIASMAFQMKQKITFTYVDYLIAAAVLLIIGVVRLPIWVALLVFVPVAIWIYRPRKDTTPGEDRV